MYNVRLRLLPRLIGVCSRPLVLWRWVLGSRIPRLWCCVCWIVRSALLYFWRRVLRWNPLVSCVLLVWLLSLLLLRLSVLSCWLRLRLRCWISWLVWLFILLAWLGYSRSRNRNCWLLRTPSRLLCLISSISSLCWLRSPRKIGLRPLLSCTCLLSGT